LCQPLNILHFLIDGKREAAGKAKYDDLKKTAERRLRRAAAQVTGTTGRAAWCGA
jgi:hypothetical protein